MRLSPHVSIRWRLLFGDFTYTSRGILDETHVHFFTKRTLLDFLERSEYRVETVIPTADFGQLPFLGRFLRHLPKRLQFTVTRIFPTFLGVQFIVVATPIKLTV